MGVRLHNREERKLRRVACCVFTHRNPTRIHAKGFYAYLAIHGRILRARLCVFTQRDSTRTGEQKDGGEGSDGNEADTDAADGQGDRGGGSLPRIVVTRAQTRSHPRVQPMDDSMAAQRCDELAEESSGGRVTFRKYDNDSDARRRGTYERLPARRLWVSSCEMFLRDVHHYHSWLAAALRCWRPVGDLRAAGDLLEQRGAELRVVLGSLELGWLHGPLVVEAGIRSLASLRSSLRSESTSGLVTKLKGVGKQCNAAVCQKLLTLGLLTGTSDAPEPLVLMRD